MDPTILLMLCRVLSRLRALSSGVGEEGVQTGQKEGDGTMLRVLRVCCRSIRARGVQLGGACSILVLL